MNYELIFLAAGKGKRMNLNKNKMWVELFGEPIFVRSLRSFLVDRRCTHIVIVCQKDEYEQTKTIIRNLNLGEKEIKIVSGGEERQYSVANGLSHTGRENIVLVHDGARPFVSIAIIDRLLKGLTEQQGAICAVKVKDTLKKTKCHLVERTLSRDDLWQVQTPQAFIRETLIVAHKQAEKDHFLGTDEASLVERLHIPIQVVEGSYYNIKITTAEDLTFAKAIIREMKGERYE